MQKGPFMKKLACLSLGMAFCLSTFATPSFTMRFDDNHAPAEWQRAAQIFERYGMRCSLAVVPSKLTEEQGACLKDLAARGHLIMDHTPNHSFYTVTYHDKVAFDRAKTKPFVHEVDEKDMTLRFMCEVNGACPDNRKVKATIRDNVVTFANPKAAAQMYCFLGLPGRSEVFGMEKKGGKTVLLDFWRRPLKEKINLTDVELTVYGQAALQPCDDILRELASVSRERFDHFGLPRPTIWVRPGGWCPGIAWDRLERIYGREFGYVGADSSIGASKRSSRWTTGYDAMYFFDQGAEITPEQLVDQIQKRLASGAYHVTLSHMWGRKLPGKMNEFFEKTERFAQLLAERKIPTLTMAGSLDARFGRSN